MTSATKTAAAAKAVLYCHECSDAKKKTVAIYTCPRCSAHTCCLECCKAHKMRTKCSGKRPSSDFLRVSQMNDSTLAKDYTFLNTISNSISSTSNAGNKSNNNKRFKINGTLAFVTKFAKFAYTHSNTIIRYMPTGMLRHDVQNKSYFKTLKKRQQLDTDGITDAAVPASTQPTTTTGSVVETETIVESQQHHVDMKRQQNDEEKEELFWTIELYIPALDKAVATKSDTNDDPKQAGCRKIIQSVSERTNIYAFITSHIENIEQQRHDSNKLTNNKIENDGSAASTKDSTNAAAATKADSVDDCDDTKMLSDSVHFARAVDTITGNVDPLSPLGTTTTNTNDSINTTTTNDGIASPNEPATATSSVNAKYTIRIINANADAATHPANSISTSTSLRDALRDVTVIEFPCFEITTCTHEGCE